MACKGVSTLVNELRSVQKIYAPKKVEQSVWFEDNGNVRIGNKTYIPEPTARLFHADNSFVRLILGPIRSGKSSSCCIEIVKRACEVPPCKSDGIRRSRFAVIRNTYPQLTTTTVKTWENWCGQLGEVRTCFDSPIEFFHKFNDGKGDVELTVWFLALERPKDIGKLLSLETTGAYCNELKELPYKVYESLRGRVGSWPPKNDLVRPLTWYGVFNDTNPPDADHWIYRVFEQEMPNGHALFKQPSAILKTKDGKWMLNPDAENIKNLQTGLYENLISGSQEDFIKVYLLGQYGSVEEGKRVFPNYNDDIHAIDNIQIVPRETVYLGWDGGLTPACILVQYINGQMRIIKEFVTERMGSKELAEAVVLPWLRVNCHGSAIITYSDPSNITADDVTGEMHVIKMLNELGLNAEQAKTNDIVPRIEAINSFLNRNVEGKAAFVLSKQGCPALRKAFLNKYIYKRLQVVGDERYRDVPDKTHPYSDIIDCVQYVSLALSGYKEKPKQDYSQWSKERLVGSYNQGLSSKDW